MAISVSKIRTASMTARLTKHVGRTDVCELCLKPILPDRQRYVMIDHESYEFVTDQESKDRGDAVSLFPVGAACERRIRKALYNV